MKDEKHHDDNGKEKSVISRKKGILRKLAPLEIAVIAAILVGLLAVVSVMLANLSDYSTVDNGVRSLELPWKGEKVSVVQLSSGWNQSDESIPLYCPFVAVAVDEEPDTNGEVFIQFMDDQGTPMGDPLSFPVENSRKERERSNTMTLRCTKGIEGVSYMNQYILDDRNPWRFHVYFKSAQGNVVHLGSGDVARILHNKKGL